MTKVKKIFEDKIYHGYAVLRLKSSERDFIIFASEENGCCYAYDLDNEFKKIGIWYQIGESLDFLATQKFYPSFNSEKC